MKRLVFYCLFVSNPFLFSQSQIKKDIEDQYINALYIDSDSTLATEF